MLQHWTINMHFSRFRKLPVNFFQHPLAPSLTMPTVCGDLGNDISAPIPTDGHSVEVTSGTA